MRSEDEEDEDDFEEEVDEDEVWLFLRPFRLFALNPTCT